MKSRFFLSFIIAFCFFVSNTSAQIPSSVNGLDISASTDNPVPGQTVTITARSYSLDINSAKVSWVVNGTTVKDSVGATVLEVKAPALGKTLSIKISATTPQGRTDVGTIVIGSGSVDLIFETDGYTSPFFKGKISPVYQNSVKIVAIPHLANANGQEYDPKTLIYQWKRNSRAIESQSGYGKQSITLIGDIVPRPYDISVDVWPRDDSTHAQGMTEVSVAGPTINFYADDPLYGPLFNRAINSIVRIGSQKETTVLAVPFGFNKSPSGVGNLSWSWSINDSIRSELSTNESIVLRAPDDSTGSSNIQLNIINADKILQGAREGFSATFSAEKVGATEQLTF
jgi:hypothetical protein